MKKLLCILMVCALACMAAGCSSKVSELNEEQLDVVAEYAASMLIKHDKNYADRYKDAELTTEEKDLNQEEVTSKPADETEGNEKATSNNNEETTTVKNGKEAAIEDVLGLEGFTVVCKDYNIRDSYPDENSKDAFFVMRPVKGSKLLVVTLEVKNISGKEQKINVLDYNARYKAIVNKKSRLNAQITLLLDAFNTYEGTFKKNEMKELVLVYQTAIQNTKDIKSLTLELSCNEREGIITLK